jgi:hypothetical protein
MKSNFKIEGKIEIHLKKIISQSQTSHGHLKCLLNRNNKGKRTIKGRTVILLKLCSFTVGNPLKTTSKTTTAKQQLSNSNNKTTTTL